MCMVDIDYPVSPERGLIYLVDYDIPREPASKRMRFYRKFRDLRRKHKLFMSKFSTRSVFYTRNKAVAADVYNLASKYGRSHLYEVTQLLP